MRCVLCGPASDMAEVDEEEKCPRCLYEFVCYAAQHDMAQGLTKKKSARGVCTRRVLRGPPSDMAEVGEEETCPRCLYEISVYAARHPTRLGLTKRQECTRCLYEMRATRPNIWRGRGRGGGGGKCARCLYETRVTRPAIRRDSD